MVGRMVRLNADSDSYMLLPPLYAQQWTCTFQKSALWLFLAILFSLGHVLVAVHYTAMAIEELDAASVLVYVLGPEHRTR
jgi:hypothetical protein